MAVCFVCAWVVLLLDKYPHFVKRLLGIISFELGVQEVYVFFVLDEGKGKGVGVVENDVKD